MYQCNRLKISGLLYKCLILLFYNDYIWINIKYIIERSRFYNNQDIAVSSKTIFLLSTVISTSIPSNEISMCVSIMF